MTDREFSAVLKQWNPLVKRITAKYVKRYTAKGWELEFDNLYNELCYILYQYYDAYDPVKYSTRQKYLSTVLHRQANSLLRIPKTSHKHEPKTGRRPSLLSLQGYNRLQLELNKADSDDLTDKVQLALEDDGCAYTDYDDIVNSLFLDSIMVDLTANEIKFMYYYRLGYSGKAIAEAMNVSAQRVHQIRYNIIKRIRRRI